MILRRFASLASKSYLRLFLVVISLLSDEEKCRMSKTAVRPETNKTIRAIMESVAAMWVALALWLCGCLPVYGQFTNIDGARAVPRPDLGHEYIQLLDETVYACLQVFPNGRQTVPVSLCSASVKKLHDQQLST
jgi:hypothetical protein